MTDLYSLKLIYMYIQYILQLTVSGQSGVLYTNVLMKLKDVQETLLINVTELVQIHNHI